MAAAPIRDRGHQNLSDLRQKAISSPYGASWSSLPSARPWPSSPSWLSFSLQLAC